MLGWLYPSAFCFGTSKQNTKKRKKINMKARYWIQAELCWVQTSDSWAGWNIKDNSLKYPVSLVAPNSYGLKRFGVKWEKKKSGCHWNFIIWHNFAKLEQDIVISWSFQKATKLSAMWHIRMKSYFRKGMSRGRQEELNRNKLSKNFDNKCQKCTVTISSSQLFISRIFSLSQLVSACMQLFPRISRERQT